MKMQNNTFGPLDGDRNNGDKLSGDAAYPSLAKENSDGAYCFFVQRRLSWHISLLCVRWRVSANTATGIDMAIAVLAAWCVSQGYYLTGVVLIQFFGLWSCVDGEIARLTDTQSKLGDFYDTMTDRLAEFVIFAGVLYSLLLDGGAYNWGILFFAYMGMVFLLTASSEKYRAVYRENYPKSDHEKPFNLLCAGSDTRFLFLSVALIFYSFTGNKAIIAWVIIALSILLAANFLFRMWKISTLPVTKD